MSESETDGNDGIVDYIVDSWAGGVGSGGFGMVVDQMMDSWSWMHYLEVLSPHRMDVFLTFFFLFG